MHLRIRGMKGELRRNGTRRRGDDSLTWCCVRFNGGHDLAIHRVEPFNRVTALYLCKMLLVDRRLTM